MNFVYNFLKTFKKENKNKLISNYLYNKIIRFTYLANAVSKKKIEIMKADDNVGGYYDDKIILPSVINLFNKNNLFYFYVYRILFSLKSSSFNFYLKEDKKNYDYIMLNTLLTIKKINYCLFNDYPKLIEIIKILYNDINKKRKNLDFLDGRAFLIEIIVKKYMYQRIKIKKKLKFSEKFWIYLVENSIITDINYLYEYLCKIYNFYNNIEFNQIWGYLYYKKDFSFKCIDNIKLNKKTSFLYNKEENIVANKKIVKSDESKKNSLSSLFDYKKTLDNYNKNNNKNMDSNSLNDINILKTVNHDNVIRSNLISSSTFSLKNINNIIVNNFYSNNYKNKKFLYKEWDCNSNIYKQDWCEVFLSNKKNKIFLKNNKDVIDQYLKNYKKEILFLKNNIKLMMNKKNYINNLRFGSNLNIDSIIDNYKYIKKFGFDKIYKDKRIKEKDMCLCIIFDLSLSTDSFLDDIKISDFLKILVFIISCSIDNFINYSVAAFYSNTRYDCKYIVLKNFNDNWKNCKYNLSDLYPSGYTRIGPAIRHSIQELNKLKFKKKVILLLSDGKPTDYDEYEGFYGVNDIRRASNEALVKNIKLKSLIISKNKKQYFNMMFGENKFYTISNSVNIGSKLSELFFNIIVKNL